MKRKRFFLKGQHGSSIVMEDLDNRNQIVLLEPVDRDLSPILLDLFQRIYNMGVSDGERTVRANLARQLGL